MIRPWLLACCLMLACAAASASGTVSVIPNAQVWRASVQQLLGPYRSTKELAFEALKPQISAAYPGNNPGGFCAVVRTVTFQAYGFTVNHVYAQNGYPESCGSPPAPAVYTASFSDSYINLCPDHAEGSPQDNPTACTCVAGYKPSSDAKSCRPDCTSGEVVSSGYFDIGPNAGADPLIVGCSGKCLAVFGGESPVGSQMVGGVKHWFAKGEYRLTGDACSPAKEASSQVGTATSTKPEGTCASGQAKGQVNGKTVCVDQTGDDSTKPTPESETKETSTSKKETTTNPDGSTTVTETKTRIDGDGNKETTVIRTTTKPDGSVQTDTEVTNPQSGSKDGKSDDSEKGECEQNPSAAGCGGAPAAIDTLYNSKDRTLSDVLSAHAEAFRSSPLGSAVSGFFSVSGGAGCPTYSGRIPYIDAELTIDQHCSAFGVTALEILKGALLVVASFFAFRIAIE